MSKALFIDIPVLDEKWDPVTRKLVEQRFMAQDVVNILGGCPKPYQQKRKQFSRGILIISSYIEDSGHKASYITFNRMHEKDFESSVNGADVVGITGNNTAYFNVVKSLARRVKEIDKDTPVIVGGFHVSALDKQSLQESEDIDIIVRGEGEAAFLDILNGKEPVDIPGITYRNRRSGEIKRNLEGSRLNPDSLPNPAYHILPASLRDYNYNIQTIMGCTFRCTYCPNGYFWETPRVRNFERTLEELEFLDSQLARNTLVHFSDNIFSLVKDRSLRLCNEIGERDLGLLFSCDLKSEFANQELVKAMDNAKFVKISIGFEDGNDSILLEKAKRVANFQSCIDTSKLIKENSDIFLEAYWVLGLPGSTHETMQHTMNMARHILRNNVVDVISSSTIFTPLPGTPMYHMADKYGVRILSKNWDEWLRSNYYPVYELDTLTRDEIYSYANIFEELLLDEYSRKLGKSKVEIFELHRKLMASEEYQHMLDALDVKFGKESSVQSSDTQLFSLKPVLRYSSK